MTLYAHIEQYLKHQTNVRKISETTLRNLHEDLTHWSHFINDNNINTVDKITPDILDEWTYFEQGRGIAVGTWNRKATSVRSFLRYMHGRGNITTPLYEVIGRSKEQNRTLPKTLSTDRVHEVEEAFDEFSGLKAARFQALWGLMTYDGLRVGELFRLNTDSLTTVQGIPALNVMGKGMRGRQVILSTKTFNWIQNYMTIRKQYLTWCKAITNALFVTEKGRLSVRQIQRMVKAKTAGNATPHVLRRTAVTETVNNLADLSQLPLIADQFGHTIPIMQRHYLKPRAATILAIKSA